MCRSIKPLQNLEPAATPDEVHSAALQYVRKISGASHPSKANEAAVESAVVRIAAISQELLDALVTSAPPRGREEEAVKAKARFARRLLRDGARA